MALIGWIVLKIEICGCLMEKYWILKLNLEHVQGKGVKDGKFLEHLKRKSQNLPKFSRIFFIHLNSSFNQKLAIKDKKITNVLKIGSDKCHFLPSNWLKNSCYGAVRTLLLLFDILPSWRQFSGILATMLCHSRYLTLWFHLIHLHLKTNNIHFCGKF